MFYPHLCHHKITGTGLYDYYGFICRPPSHHLLQSAHQAKVEKGEMLRIDRTVTDSPIHEPSDSTLLWDSVRVLVRLLKRAEELADGVTVIEYRNHQRVAKKRMRAICYTRGRGKKARLYRDLVDATNKRIKRLFCAPYPRCCASA